MKHTEKQAKRAVAFLLACGLILPSALFTACQTATDESLPPPPTSEESGSVETPPTEAPLPPTSEDSGSDEEAEQPEEPVVKTERYFRCTGDGVNLRSGAGTGYSSLGSAEKNTRYILLGKTGNWYRTYYKGKIAYVHASYAAVFELQTSDNERAESVLREGYKLIGVPYVYGAVRLHDGNGNFLKGFSAQKFDCSSLVQYVFYQGAGEVLQVHTRSQIKQGKKIAAADIRRGDCLFFTNESRKHLTGIERVGHVAVYLGDNYILHTASDYARIEPISDARWKFFLEARRYV